MRRRIWGNAPNPPCTEGARARCFAEFILSPPQAGRRTQHEILRHYQRWKAESPWVTGPKALTIEIKMAK
jgi:hypothetical protein